jgi:hypothetical protein
MSGAAATNRALASSSSCIPLHHVIVATIRLLP